MSQINLPLFRIGFGVDVHQLADGYSLVIGGVKIPSEFGAVGHSDADVLLHAICDALLGAAGLKDIGHQFPDTDPQYKGIDSKILLQKTFDLVEDKGFQLGNIDATVMLESPKLSPYTDEMRSIIAEILKSEVDQISIKATRGEKLGFVGKGEGIKAYCNCLLFPANIK
ncbi:2-C-methyl-D-erythritol 2,4-cyclodiphosphate synthase [Paracrocinitomix mangrovi]|uniref:2-C-methyl-D-erythritol 2,4-cyclodiphosphate synthase n=1 Tax=Paracrocinitomix mangrovi TaxID=2862509 RepID=UPI001EDBCC09|nr:2-C-methyl-D-erythritol 2,4-cyclodiphosphate synthase [Paracrocinitomix mangrovi]UKN03191.1 2-C-methyl-D-erythritol 2,4-cyclodiphosphate synthase [Paracrocinitomix mangrovi]